MMLGEGKKSEEANVLLFFRFYIESISFLKDRTTVELFFLNAKSCVHKVRLDGSRQTASGRGAGSLCFPSQMKKAIISPWVFLPHPHPQNVSSSDIPGREAALHAPAAHVKDRGTI